MPAAREGDDDILEAPAYLGRPFPDSSAGRMPLIARGVVGVSVLGFFSFAGSALSFNNNRLAAGVFFLVVGIGCVALAIVSIRSFVRRVVRTEGATGPRHWYR